MRIFFLIFLLIFIPFTVSDVYSDLSISVDKDEILPFGDTAMITINLDYLPKNNMVMVNFFDSREVEFQGARQILVNNGVLQIDFQGYKQEMLGGIYKVVVTGINEKNETITDVDYFSIGVKQEKPLIDENTESGGCLIATATFGTELAPQVQTLREIRDNVVLKTESGQVFMTLFNTIYYSFSPSISDIEREHIFFKETVKIGLVPLLQTLSILSIDEDISEIKLIFFGVVIIGLNILIYFIAPYVLLMKLKFFMISKIRSTPKTLKNFS